MPSGRHEQPFYAIQTGSFAVSESTLNGRTPRTFQTEGRTPPVSEMSLWSLDTSLWTRSKNSVKTPRGATVVALFLVGLGVSVASLVMPFPPWIRRPDETSLVLFTSCGFAFLLGGLFISLWHPNNRIGRLMTAASFAWFSVNLNCVDSNIAFTIGSFSYILYLAIIEHMFIVFPYGYLRSATDRALVIAIYCWCLGLNALAMLVWDSAHYDCFNGGCPRNLFEIYPDPALNMAMGRVLCDGTCLLMAGTLFLVAFRWRQATVATRRIMTPVALGAIPVAASTLIDQGIQYGTPWPIDLWSQPGQWLLLAVPVSILLGLLRLRLGHAALAELVVQLNTLPQGEPWEKLRQLLRKTMRDPTVDFGHRHSKDAPLINADGHVIDLAMARSTQGIQELEDADGTVHSVLLYDPILDQDPRLVRAVVEAVKYTVQNERLEAERQARLKEIQELTVRMVTAADTERRRIERNLHDGSQQTLLALEILLARCHKKASDGDLSTLPELLSNASEMTSSVVDGLRDFCRGMHPTILSEAGLEAALESLQQRSPLDVSLDLLLPERLPALAETTAYFVASEALANATKHAHANVVTIRAAIEATELVVEIRDDGVGGATFHDGGGLQGLADRVAAVHGQFQVYSPAGDGTGMIVRIPCA
jgi:signal transduction histidine kinase